MDISAELVCGESRIADVSLRASRLPQATMIACLLLFSTALPAQIPPLQPPPLQTPSGGEVCSVEKSCAELAPAMIRSALGPSPLEANLRHLANLNGAHATGSPPTSRAIAWAVEAFRRAGVDEVHTEKFSIPVGGIQSRKQVNRMSGLMKSENVVAEIRGREKPDEFVLLGAHLDSSRIGAGALADASNAALVIDAARVVHASGSLPRRSIRFVLFTESSNGMLGSWAFARAHRADLDKMAAAIVFDIGDAPMTGYALGARADTFSVVREALDPLGTLGVTDFTLNARIPSDSFDFLIEGVPTLTTNAGAVSSTPNDHSPSGTPDKVNIGSLKRNVAVAAVTAYALADAAERVGPRLTRVQIERSLEETGLEREMKVEGLWPLWEAGERGRQP
ncbi:MAG: M28 family metallopeptidase, partial [Candidatus Acidiferrales bacterium]